MLEIFLHLECFDLHHIDSEKSFPFSCTVPVDCTKPFIDNSGEHVII